MRTLLMGLTGLGAVALAGVAVAQGPTPAAGGPGGPGSGQGQGSGMEMRAEHGPEDHGWRGMMHGMRREPPSKAARFMFRRGDAVVAVKCADDEAMKACVDAAAVLMDKLAVAPR